MFKLLLATVLPRVFRGGHGSGLSQGKSRESHHLDLHAHPRGWTSTDGTITPAVDTSVTAGPAAKMPSAAADDDEERMTEWRHRNDPQTILRHTEVVVSRPGDSDSTASSRRPVSLKEHV